MIDALVNTPRYTFRVFKTPDFTRNGQEYKLKDKFVGGSKKAVFPTKKLVEGGTTPISVNGNSSIVYNPMQQPNNLVQLGAAPSTIR